jgi:hypothetical protein
LVKSARTVKIANFDANYQVVDSYVINGSTYNDDGKNNDIKAGDGIYTSIELFENLKNSNVKPVAFASDSFLYASNLSSKFGLTITCKLSFTRSGTSALGFSCRTGCIVVSDCEASFEFSF